MSISQFKDRPLQFLLDPGAEISVIKVNKLDLDVKVNPRDIVPLQGITNELKKSVGSTHINFNFHNFSGQHKVYLVTESFPIPCDGLLGSDFFMHFPCDLSFKDNCLKIYSDSQKLNQIAAFKAANVVKIPPRTEMFHKTFVQSQNDILCHSKQLSKNVYMGNCICRPIENFIYVPIINGNDEEVEVDLNKITFECISEYSIMALNSSQNINRTNKILEDINIEHLNSEEKESIIDIVCSYNDVFYLEGDKLSSTNATTHKIHTSVDKPICSRQYRVPTVHKNEINEQVNKMLKEGIVTESSSPWNSPLLVVPKKGDSNGIKKWRVVVDFRKINDVTLSDAYPLPLITDILDQLGRARYFSNLDLASGFHQIEMDPQDSCKTAFSTPFGHYEFSRMPFGLKNAPATFQRLMNTVLLGLQGFKCFIYMDDIVVYGDTLIAHNKKLTEILERLRQHELKLQPSKCNFLQKEIVFLGHKITSEGIKPDEAKIQAVKNFPSPKNYKDVKTFLGMMSYYRKFIPNLSNLAEPINRLLKKGQKFVWSVTCQQSFDELKSLLMSSPILQYPDFTKKFVITTDASNVAIGAVLSNEDKNLPIAYASRILNAAERRYSTVERELLAIVWAIKHFKPYVYGREFLVHSDHKPLVYLFNVTNSSDRLMRWRLSLEEYDFKVIYKPGKQNVVADALSRIELTNMPNVSSILDEIGQQIRAQKSLVAKNINIITRLQAKQAASNTSNSLIAQDFKVFETLINPAQNNYVLDKQGKGSKCVRVTILSAQLDPKLDYEFDKTAFESENISQYGYSKSLKMHFVVCKDLQQHKVCKYRLYKNLMHLKKSLSNLRDQTIDFKFVLSAGDEINWLQLRSMVSHIFSDVSCRLCFNNNFVKKISSQDEINQILHEFHDAPLGGHTGIERMVKRISERYNWPNMKQNIKSYVLKCKDCQKNKILKTNKIPMKITTTSEKPFDKVYLDIVGPLPKTMNGNSYILTIQDDLSKHFIAKAIKEATAESTCKAFLESGICVFGIPTELVTDRGTNFISKLFQELCKLLKIKQIQTSAYHPQSNGALERCHRTLKEYLRSYVNENLDNWDEYLSQFSFTYNTTPHSSTGYTPHELVYGYKAELPSAIVTAQKDTSNYFQYLKDLRSKMESIHKIAIQNLKKAKEIRKEKYDGSANEWIPLWGEKVLLLNISTGVGQKLQGLWNGPHEVVAINSPETTSIKLCNSNKTMTVHNNRLKKYTE